MPNIVVDILIGIICGLLSIYFCYRFALFFIRDDDSPLFLMVLGITLPIAAIVSSVISVLIGYYSIFTIITQIISSIFFGWLLYRKGKNDEF
jgi:putative effector of murein hydrolase